MVIFDCDGVLVDSEVLLTDVHVTQLRKLGLDITHAELTERFLGVTDRAMHAALEADLGAPFPDDYDREVKAELRRRGARELHAVPGAAAALRRVHGPCCVASSSAQAELEFKLDATGLAPYFSAMSSAQMLSPRASRRPISSFTPPARCASTRRNVW